MKLELVGAISWFDEAGVRGSAVVWFDKVGVRGGVVGWFIDA